MQYTSFSDAQIKALTEEMDTTGYAVLPGWATSEQLVELKNLVAKTITAAGNTYVALTGPQVVAGSLLYEWGCSPVFLDLCQRIVETATGRKSTEQGLYQVLRCLTGESGRRESLIFHYDSYVLTMVLPVCLPDKGARGDLLMLPNNRPVRHNYALNLLDKLRVDNRWIQRRLAKAYANKADKFTQIQMRPGDLYFFWGYRSLHTNLPADPSGVRATAVFHYDNVHGGSSIASRIRQALGYFKPRPSNLARGNYENHSDAANGNH